MITNKYMNKNNRYEYCRRGNLWAVYSPEGSKVDSFIEREDARKLTFKLNGWEYKPKQETKIQYYE